VVVIPVDKRSAEPVIFVSEPGCALDQPVKMDAFGMSLVRVRLMVGNIVKA
jgi:hypothetical protein